jgi:hypothetical protein
MRLWLARASFVLAVVVTALLLGNLEAVGVALLLITLVRRRESVRPTSLKAALLSVWLGTFLLAGVVTAVATGPQTETRRKLVLGLYDLNCSAPFGSYRRPRDVMWLAERNLYYGNWNRVLVAGRRSSDGLTRLVLARWRGLAIRPSRADFRSEGVFQSFRNRD